jgi:hypothetical protein
MSGLTSVVSYPERGEGGNNRYRGNCSPKLIEGLIAQFGVKEICDFMCGSNTTADAARSKGIQSKTYDLHSGFDLLTHDIAERPEFIFWHPPYHDIVVYSDVMYSAAKVQERYGFDPRQSDLSRIPTWEGFVEAMNRCMMKQFCALERGGRMAVLVGDIKKKGKLYSMLFELMKPGTLENVVIKTQHNCVSDRTSYSGKFIPILHEYLLLLRKDAPLIFPILISKTEIADIRELPGATWKDVVAAVMEECGGESELSGIYAKVETFKRAQTQYWREKVRQTLQYHPDLFSSPRRGVWALNRRAS